MLSYRVVLAALALGGWGLCASSMPTNFCMFPSTFTWFSWIVIFYHGIIPCSDTVNLHSVAKAKYSLPWKKIESYCSPCLSHIMKLTAAFIPCKIMSFERSLSISICMLVAVAKWNPTEKGNFSSDFNCHFTVVSRLQVCVKACI